jgi:fatty acid desaturase
VSGAAGVDPAEDALGSELRRHLKAEAIQVPREVTGRSTLAAIGYVAAAHAWIAAAVAIGRWLPGGPTAKLAAGSVAILLAQRALQTLVHHLSHGLLATRRGWNDGLGDWLVAGAIGMRIANYRRVHFVHHAENGSAADPEFIDFAAVRARGGLGRYVLHFVVGGEALALVRKYYLPGGRAPTRGAPGGPLARALGLVHVAVAQLGLLALFVLVARAWYLYAAWLYVAVTWSPMLSRLRFLVEHPGLGDRTVSSEAPAWERAFFAPYQFNYHFEHHAWPGVPPYRLHRVHRHLAEVGYFARHPEFRAGSFLASLARRGEAPVDP